MIGIGGVSMSGIAIILQKAGYEVTGSDKNEGDMIDILTKNGIPVFIGSNAEWVKDAIRKVKRFMEDEESLSKSSQKIMRANQEKRKVKEEEEVEL